jgi:hypothetical protein
MTAAMRARGVSSSLGEGIIVRPSGDVRDHAEPPRSRALDEQDVKDTEKRHPAFMIAPL